MNAPQTSGFGRLGTFVLAFGLAIPLAAMSGHVVPGHIKGLELGNDFIALFGLSWAAIQLVSDRRSQILRRAWTLGALGCLLIAFEDHLERFAAPFTTGLVEHLASAALWFAAAFLLLAAGRPFASRRGVMPAIRWGFAVTVLAVGLNLALGAGIAHGRHLPGRIEEFAELLATALFVAGLLLARAAPLKNYRFAPHEIGAKARALFYDFGLQTRQRYPVPFSAFGLPGLRHLATLAIILYYLPRAAGAVRRETGVGFFAQALDLLRAGFVHGVDAKSYYVHDLYRDPELLAATLTRVETKNGLNRALQNLRGTRPGPRDMNDKLEFWRACEANGIESAPILAVVEQGAVVWADRRETFDRDLFVKERKGRGGRFTLTYERLSPFLYRDGTGALVNLDEVARELQGLSQQRRLMVQPKLANHPAIASLADQALIVFRVMTCMDQRGEPQATHGVMRLLRRFEPNWPKTPDADWGCAIDPETGVFGMLTGDAPETCTRWFHDHPVTGERVAGRTFEGWPEIAEAARAAHRVFSARTLVGWDIAWTPDGAVILEGNSNPDFSYFQRVSRTPVGRSPLGPLLGAHLDMVMARLAPAPPT